MNSFTVKASLTSKHERSSVENNTYAAFVRRIVAAHGRRIAAGDVEGLTELVGLAETIEQATDAAVAGLRSCGYSWAEIAAPLGISRQAAQQRWATRDDFPKSAGVNP
jgi:hypothetical protein